MFCRRWVVHHDDVAHAQRVCPPPSVLRVLHGLARHGRILRTRPRKHLGVARLLHAPLHAAAARLAPRRAALHSLTHLLHVAPGARARAPRGCADCGPACAAASAASPAQRVSGSATGAMTRVWPRAAASHALCADGSPAASRQAAAPAMVAVAPLPADGKLYDEADLDALNNDTKARSHTRRAGETLRCAGR